ncbi:nucleobindin-1-like [Mercenaria mercenaria]|uniref:nucleobindin-1-like n=1 Tax=Mercenaria mercenaria TaxID=6596 RepID=UPI00234E6D25|nr:nucleobindin-1-like [Mercenaria mercenaria]
MRWLVSFVLLASLMQEITCPPVQPEIKPPVEGDSPDDDDPTNFMQEDWEDFAYDVEEGFGLEYDRYLKEIVMALEEDEAFRKKLEEMNMTDIKNGKIAMHLDLVSHQIRERLDEIKRQEMNRLRELAKEKMKQMKGMEVLGSIAKYGGIQKMDENFLHHVDVKNPHSFEAKDLERLIKKATNDLDEIDKKRRGEFKTYEMEKEHQRREELKNLDEEHRKAKEEEYENMKKRHEEHPKIHHPGSKAQLEGVWEKTDHMDPEDFDPKTFFNMHDIDGNGFLDQDEVEALFQKEPLGQDPNVQHMQMPQGGQGMPPQGMHQQQQFQQHEQQQQFQQHGQQQQFQQHEQQQQMRQMGQMQGQAPVGQGQMHGGPPGMGQGQMPGYQGAGQGQVQGGPPGMGQGQVQGGPPAMGQGQGGQVPPGQMPQGQGQRIPRPPPVNVDVGKVNQAVPVSDGQGQAQGVQGQNVIVQDSQGQQPQKEAAEADPGVPVQNVDPNLAQGQQILSQNENTQGQNIANHEQEIKVEALGQPSPERQRQQVPEGMPPVQNQVPQQQPNNAQQQGQGQDALRFQGQGQEQQKQPQQPLV